MMVVFSSKRNENSGFISYYEYFYLMDFNSGKTYFKVNFQLKTTTNSYKM